MYHPQAGTDLVLTDQPTKSLFRRAAVAGAATVMAIGIVLGVSGTALADESRSSSSQSGGAVKIEESVEYKYKYKAEHAFYWDRSEEWDRRHRDCGGHRGYGGWCR